MPRFTPSTEGDRILPITYGSNEKPLAVLNNAFNIIYKDEIITRTKGYETLEFDIPLFDSKRNDILIDRLLDFGGRMFRIKLIEDERNTSNLTHVTCYALWYDLMGTGDWSATYTTATTPTKVLNDLVLSANDNWTYDTTIGQPIFQGMTFKPNSRLYNLRYAAKLWKLVPIINTQTKRIELYDPTKPIIFGDPFHVKKNIRSMSRTTDSRNLTTRYAIYGKDDITMASANGGKEYRENYTWMDSVRMPRRIWQQTKSDDRFTIPANMVQAADDFLAIYSKPLITYEVDVIVLSELPELLYAMLVVDEEFGIQDILTVVSREINYSTPSKSKITFSDPRADFMDLLNEDEL